MNDKIKIPDNHRRRLSVTSKYVESGLNEIEDLLNNDGREQITQNITRNIDKEKKKKILELTRKLRIENEKMFKEVNLSPDKLYEDRIIRGTFSYIWTILIDSTATKMKGYGELSEGESELIDSYVNVLVDIVYKIQSIIH
jgi:hypothetical protein